MIVQGASQGGERDEGGGWWWWEVPSSAASSRSPLPLLLLDTNQLQLLFAILVVRGQTLVLLQQLFVLLHQTGCVLLVLLILVQFSNQLLPVRTHKHTRI